MVDSLALACALGKVAGDEDRDGLFAVGDGTTTSSTVAVLFNTVEVGAGLKGSDVGSSFVSFCS